ncbi:MAG TPA: prepilin-type N-terminal cleavage/methylation domain-containing protein [Pyrinomonadaceae bacterium]|jgi:prepilin-type N-terminal cleavage/methylation domain-containing protein
MALVRQKDGERGFTLVELIITMVIMLIVLGILSGIIAGVQSEYKAQRTRMEAISNAQTAQDNISRILRMAGTKGIQCDSTFQVEAITPASQNADGSYSSLTIQADWNPADCQLTGTDENVTISVQNGILYLDAARLNPFVERINAVRFRFYDKANQLISNAVTNKQQISYIQIEVDAQTSETQVTTVKTSSRIRGR